MHTRFVALSFFLLLTPFQTPGPATPAHAPATPEQTSPCILQPEDYAVYSAVLLNRGKPEDPEERWDDKPDLIIAEGTAIPEETSAQNQMWGFRSNSKQQPTSEAVNSFNARRTSTCLLSRQIDPTISYRLISRSELEAIFKKGPRGWNEFYKRYPKASGYWDFSPVGYDSKGNEALVYLGHHCGGLCGTGHLVLLQKENGRWIVKNRVMLWIS